MSATPLTPGATLMQALRIVNPSAARTMRAAPPSEVLAALSDSAGAFIQALQAVGELAGACSRGDVAGATAGLGHMSAAVVAAEAAFLGACAQHGVAPDDVVDALAAMRGMLQFLTVSGAAALPT
jgi:hypothetical protein